MYKYFYLLFFLTGCANHQPNTGTNLSNLVNSKDFSFAQKPLSKFQAKSVYRISFKYSLINFSDVLIIMQNEDSSISVHYYEYLLQTAQYDTIPLTYLNREFKKSLNIWLNWDSVDTRIGNLRFWDIAENSSCGIEDGYLVIMEGYKEGKYRKVIRSSPFSVGCNDTATAAVWKESLDYLFSLAIVQKHNGFILK